MLDNQNARASFFMVVSMLSFSIGDTSIKAVGEEGMPLSQLLVLRGILASGFLLWLAHKNGHLTFIVGRTDWSLLGLRSLGEVGAAWMFLTALVHLPLANANAIMQSIPLVVTLGASLFLGEKVGPRRWSAIVIGFCGMLLIVRPGAAGFSIYAVYALGAVFFVSLRDLVTSRLSQNVPSLMVSLTGAIAVLVFACVLSLAEQWIALTPWLIAMVLLQSVSIICAYHFSVLTMRLGEAGFTAPFRYASLVFALIFGFVFFGEWPDWMTQLGAAIIVSTGVFIMWRERALAKQA